MMKTLQQIPGVCLFPFWLAMYASVCFITRKLSRRASCQGKTSMHFTAAEYEEMKHLWELGSACFGVVLLVQTANIVFQISAKKRILGSLVFFINAVACSTYVAQSREWIVPVMDSKGREVQIARCLSLITHHLSLITYRLSLEVQVATCLELITHHSLIKIKKEITHHSSLITYHLSPSLIAYHLSLITLDARPKQRQMYIYAFKDD